MSTGTLYLVATPIGNLEDITLRAIRTLREVGIIACEDTRRTRGLLAHLGIQTPVLSLHEHNERARIPQVLASLREGRDVALVSDAGMPAISDPGAMLVGAAVRAGVRVVPVPGASAVTTAVAVADFPADRFAFVGFLPRRSAERRRMLEALTGLPMALVLFEAPHRIRETLADIENIFGDRRVVLTRELTKVHEEVLRGTAAEIRAGLAGAVRGEITLVIASAPGTAATAGRSEADARTAAAGRLPAGPAASLPPEAFARKLLDEGLSRRDAARALAAAYGLGAREAYRHAIEAASAERPGGSRSRRKKAAGET